MIPINPEAIGDPNQTPVVYLGEEAGKVLGIRQRMLSPLLGLLADISEIDGREMILDGKTWLVTTDRDVRRWIAWHIHQDAGVDEQTAAGLICRCLCGWATEPQETWRAASLAVDQHTRREIKKLLAPPAALSTDRPDQPEG